MDLKGKSRSEVKQIKGIGDQALGELIEILSNHGQDNWIIKEKNAERACVRALSMPLRRWNPPRENPPRETLPLPRRPLPRRPLPRRPLPKAAAEKAAAEKAAAEEAAAEKAATPYKTLVVGNAMAITNNARVASFGRCTARRSLGLQ